MNDRIPHTRSLLAVLGAACALSVAATPARAQSSGADPFLLDHRYVWHLQRDSADAKPKRNPS